MPSAIPVTGVVTAGVRPSDVDAWEMRLSRYVYDQTGQLADYDLRGRIVARDSRGVERFDKTGESRWVQSRQVLRGPHAGRWVVMVPRERVIESREGRTRATIALGTLAGQTLDYGLGSAVVPALIDVDPRDFHTRDPQTGEQLGARAR